MRTQQLRGDNVTRLHLPTETDGMTPGGFAAKLRVRTIGPAVGSMRLQLVGVVGYTLVLPASCLLLAARFRAAIGGSTGSRPS